MSCLDSISLRIPRRPTMVHHRVVTTMSFAAPKTPSQSNFSGEKDGRADRGDGQRERGEQDKLREVRKDGEEEEEGSVTIRHLCQHSLTVSRDEMTECKQQWHRITGNSFTLMSTIFEFLQNRLRRRKRRRIRRRRRRRIVFCLNVYNIGSSLRCVPHI